MTRLRSIQRTACLILVAGAGLAGCEPEEPGTVVYESAHPLPEGLSGLQAVWARQVEQQLAAGLALDARGRPADLSPAARVTSSGGGLRGTLIPGPETARLNEMQQFRLSLEPDPATGAGAGATIAIAGGMPLHSHGLPTQPQVRRDADGAYVIDGVRFGMPGWWQLVAGVEVGGRTELLTFDFFVEP